MASIEMNLNEHSEKYEDIKENTDDSDSMEYSEESFNTSYELGSSESGSEIDETETKILPTKEYQWRKEIKPDDCKPFTFTAEPGIKCEVEHCPLKLFELFFNDDLVNIIVEETNKNARKLSKQTINKYEWVNTNAKEIRVLVAVLIFQTIGSMNFLKKNIDFKEMRYMLIYKLLSFTDDPGAGTALSRTKPVIDHTVKRFKEVYVPQQKIIVEERMTFMRAGMVSAKNCHALNTYVVCESASGYIYNFMCQYANPDPSVGGFITGYKTDILFPLIGNLMGKGYNVYTMNYYNSLELALALAEKNTGFVGSMRTRIKNIPSDLKQTELQIGEGAFRHEAEGKMMVLKWCFKKNAYLVSTIHKGDEAMEVKKKGEPKVIPKVIVDYESADENIEFDDFTLSSFYFEEKKIKVSHKKVFRHILNMMVSNAHTLHSIKGGSMKLVKFKTLLVDALFDKYM